jgi:hypothetical protein
MVKEHGVAALQPRGALINQRLAQPDLRTRIQDVPDDTGYVLLRAVLATVMRRSDEQVGGRHLQVGDIHIDLAARTVDVAEAGVHVSRLEFELLVKFAAYPVRVVSKHELARCVWHRQHINGRTIDSHVDRCAPASALPGASPARQQVGTRLVAHHPHAGASNDRAHV